jgi:hypothetical protein
MRNAGSVAVSSGADRTDPETLRPLSFGGASDVTVAAGSSRLSDPVKRTQRTSVR